MSEKLARELFSDAQQFSLMLKDAGWIESSGDFDDNKSPVDLFKTRERPLVVGLFGGTGVGKSSLLNRLAGADIARTGVVRPTSMEITAYLHEDVELDALPEHFDATAFSANRHFNEALTDVMWVDMPDFDSDETDNKEQVLQWLPHIDLLVYVVTPERYKDAEGWRMMLENGYRHAWLFVINQWDRAESVQYSDFNSLLEGAGFPSPQIFRTVCVGQHAEDQFDEMVALIDSLSKHTIVAHLQERGWMQRLERSKSQLQKHAELLSMNSAVGVREAYTARWQEFEQSAVSHLDTPFKAYSEQFAEVKSSAVGSVLKSISGSTSNRDIATNIAVRKDAGTLWDDWLDVRCRDTLQQFQLAESEHGIPKNVFACQDAKFSQDNAGVIARHLKQSVEAAIASPGTKTQRLVATIASAAKVVLPLLALVWVAWRVVNGFVSGAEDRSAYVGLDFLVNGLLLAALGWIIPMIVERVFVPSLPDSIYRALHTGLESGLQELQGSMLPAINKVSEQKEHYLEKSQVILKRIDHLLDVVAETPDQALKRVLRSVPASG